MTVLDAQDLVNGGEAVATAVINNRVEELFYVRNLTATVDLDKAEVKTLGRRMTQHKVHGASGSGSMNVYYVTSKWSKMAIDYIKTGKITKFDLNVKNQDPSSSTGKQVVKLSGCMIDGTDITKLDIDTEALDQDVNFTFDDADIIQEFDSLN